MKRKTYFGMMILIVFSLLPLIPWFLLSPVLGLQFNYETVTHSLGQIASLVGMTMFAITFVLSTRIKPIEKLLGGLDKVYKIHMIFGSVSFMLLLLHPILLVLKFIPSRVDLAAKYILPGHGFSVDMGLIALSGMIILLCITFYVKIKYNYWKISHKFMGLFFMFAVAHIFLVRGVASRDYIFEGYYVYAGIVSAIGLIAFFYSLLFKSVSSVVYKVKSIKKGKTVYEILMSPVRKPLDYKAGQFAFFRFHNRRLGQEYHPFSIASGTGDSDIRIIVKALGDYTSRLDLLEVHDKVSVEGPYGEFTIKDHQCDMIWIAGGIGITPFIGMAKDLAGLKGCDVRLYYCAQTEDDFVALDELRSLSKTPKIKFRLVEWCSRIKGYISLKALEPINRDTKVYVCGPPLMKASLKRQLLRKGVPEESIFEEDFDFR